VKIKKRLTKQGPPLRFYFLIFHSNTSAFLPSLLLCRRLWQCRHLRAGARLLHGRYSWSGLPRCRYVIIALR